MGRGAAAHSKYMANEYKAIMLGAPHPKLKQTTSVLMQESWSVTNGHWLFVLQFLKKLKVKQLIQHNSKQVKEKSQHTCCIL